MRLRRLLVAATMAVLAAGFGLPAQADPTGDTTATLTIQAGVISITVTPDAGSLGTLVNTVDGGVLNGALGQVQVTDARTAPAGSGWVVSVISTAFTPVTGSPIPASAVSYTAGTIVKVGTATYTANNPVNLTVLVPAVTATGVTGDNSATWNPIVHVAIPGGTVAGVYSATITHSVF